MAESISSESETAYIGVGSNIGESMRNCLDAIDMLHLCNGCQVEEVSRFFRTEPVGPISQDWYVNGVVRIETTLDPHALLRSLLSIESGLGRVRRQKWGPRVIDLDILLYGNLIMENSDLTVPHPLMHQRRFVLMPLAQMKPDLMHPVLGKSMADLMDDLGVEGQSVLPLSDI